MKRLLACLLLILNAACATPQSQPFVSSVVGPALSNHALITSDGTRLPYRSWVPKAQPKAIIVALHGFNDYSHGFEIPAEYMRSRGIALFAYDQRGFGSSPSTGIWAGEHNLTRDAADMVIAVHHLYPSAPIYLLGESMGGAVAITAVNQPDFPPIDGLILSAPAIWGGETMNPLVRMTLWVAAHTVPGKMLTGEDLHILASDNIDMLRALSGDPLVIKATRVDAVYGLVQLMDDGYADISKLQVPTLVLYGAHDQVIPPEPIHQALRNANKNITVAYYPHGYHMLMRDLHGDVPLRDIASWVNDTNASLPSGYDASAIEFLK